MSSPTAGLSGSAASTSGTAIARAVPCSLDPAHAGDVVCIPCGLYLCRACDAAQHGPDSAHCAHVRYPVSSLKCYIALSEQGSSARPAQAGQAGQTAKTASAGETPLRRNWATRLGPIHVPLANCSTLYENFQRSVRLFGDRPCLGRRVLLSPGGESVNGDLDAVAGAHDVDMPAKVDVDVNVNVNVDVDVDVGVDVDVDVAVDDVDRDFDESAVGPYEYLTYRCVAERVNHLGSGLRGLGFLRQTVVGIYSRNRPEWVMTELACYAHSFVSVPLYDMLEPEAVGFIMGLTKMSVIVCSRDKVATLQRLAESPECSGLKYIIEMPVEPWDDASAKQAMHLEELSSHHHFTGPIVIRMEELEARGRKEPFSHMPPRPRDLATLVATSGTTGLPKAACLTHDALVSNVASVMHHGVDVRSTDVHFSFLSLAHNFERTVTTLVLHNGGCIAYWRGNPLQLVDDVAEAKPTIFVGVPRVYNRMVDRIKTSVRESNWLKRRLFHSAFRAKCQSVHDTGTLTHPVWDRLVFNDVAAMLGGRVRLMVTGSAPIADDVVEFLRVCFSATVLNGYGMTELSAAATITPRDDLCSASVVGVPLVCNEYKLVDVLEMGYTSQDIVQGVPQPRGEVWVRGSNVFSGYYMMKEETDETVTPDGFVRTGDIGQICPDQMLKIVDRKKAIFKLAQGEFVAPEKLEAVYRRSRYVSQIFVHGDSLRAELVAIVVADQAEVSSWARRHYVISTSFEQLLRNSKVKALVQADMEEQAHRAKLKGFERVRAFRLHAAPFTVERGVLTPTFKTKRHVARALFSADIADMYEELEQADHHHHQHNGKRFLRSSL